MGLFEYHRSFGHRHRVNSDNGVGLGIDLEIVSLGEPDPDVFAGKGPRDRVAAATVGEKTISGDLARLFLDTDVAGRGEW